MLSNPPSSIFRDACINPETLVADLRKRAQLARSLARSRGGHIDALYLESAALEIERLRAIVDSPDLVIVGVGNAATQEQLCYAAGIPVLAEIEPHPDPVYGHLFKWPAAEVDQFLAIKP
jgi:hypothetical protein